MEASKLAECTILFDKCMQLKPDKYYRTTFGPDYSFTIEKKKNNTLVLKVWDCYHTFEYQPKEVINLKDAGSLVSFLVFSPRYYAENQFTKNLSYIDNWINFIKAFRLRNYDKSEKFLK